jgi:hypothetical protein
VFRPKHTALLAGVVTTMALGGAGVAIAASGGSSTTTKSSGARHGRRRLPNLLRYAIIWTATS